MEVDADTKKKNKKKAVQSFYGVMDADVNKFKAIYIKQEASIELTADLTWLGKDFTLKVKIADMVRSSGKKVTMFCNGNSLGFSGSVVATVDGSHETGLIPWGGADGNIQADFAMSNKETWSVKPSFKGQLGYTVPNVFGLNVTELTGSIMKGGTDQLTKGGAATSESYALTAKASITFPLLNIEEHPIGLFEWTYVTKVGWAMNINVGSSKAPNYVGSVPFILQMMLAKKTLSRPIFIGKVMPAA